MPGRRGTWELYAFLCSEAKTIQKKKKSFKGQYLERSENPRQGRGSKESIGTMTKV